MASKVEKHLSRLAMPKTWKIKRKGIKWVTRPYPGPHSFMTGLPINVLIRDLLGFAKTSKEVKNILNNQEVLVDGLRKKELKLSVGLMDVISIPKLKKQYRIIFDKKGKIVAFEIKEADAKIKPCKIIGKTVLKKGKVQFNLYDGKNVLADNKVGNVGDTLVLELPSQKIKETLKLEKGVTVFLTGGNHIGETGKIEAVDEKMIHYKREDKKYETLKKYAFVIGKDKSVIQLE